MGLSSFDLLGNIPPAQKTLMKLFLRQIEMGLPELEAAVGELPDEKRLTREQVIETLTALIEMGWLVQIEKDGQARYTVQQIKTGH
ncbi:MAG: hypothetical protein HFACDABA_02273 [Anaerolineales bacterium]|nr:hypothetical protein [Anaerolineales bacterium]